MVRIKGQEGGGGQGVVGSRGGMMLGIKGWGAGGRSSGV